MPAISTLEDLVLAYMSQVTDPLPALEATR